MKLPRLLRKPAPEPAGPASASPAAARVLQVLIFSNTDLSEQEFSDQTEKIRRLASYDRDTRSWYTWVPLDPPERAAEVLTALFEAARAHGTTIRVQAQTPDEGSLARQAP